MKKVKIFLVFISIAYLVYFLGSIIYGLFKYATKENKTDFSYVHKELHILAEDSLYFNPEIRSKLRIEYSSKFKDGSYLSLYKYSDESVSANFLVRKVSSRKANLLKEYQLILSKNKVDELKDYDVERIFSYIYKIALEDNSNSNYDFIVDGEKVEVLKHNKDTLWLHGKLFNFSFGQKNTYTNEGMYMKDEGFLRKPLEVEIILFNRVNQLFLYVMYKENSDDIVPKFIIKKVLQ